MRSVQRTILFLVLVSTVLGVARLNSFAEDLTETEASVSPETAINTDARQSGKQLRVVSYKVEKTAAPQAIVSEAKSPAYQLVGYGSSGRIINDKGEMVLASGPQTGVYIYDAITSPDGKRVLVHCANLVDFIFEPHTKGRIDLPKAAPGSNMGILESWKWLDDTTLIGQASQWRKETESSRFGFEDESNVLRTRIYVYDLERKQLLLATLPKDLRERVMILNAVAPSGAIQLLDARAGSDRGRDLGWFAVRPN